MTDVLETLQKLPPKCYVPLLSNPTQTITIWRGSMGYTLWKVFETQEAAKEYCDWVNYGHATADQIEAMMVGSMFGWGVPGADPDMYAEHRRQRAAELVSAP